MEVKTEWNICMLWLKYDYITITLEGECLIEKEEKIQYLFKNFLKIGDSNNVTRLYKWKIKR